MSKLKSTIRSTAASLGYTAARLQQRLSPQPTLSILLLHHTPESRWSQLAELLDRLTLERSFIHPTNAAAMLQGNAAFKPGWLLTFDDGFVSNARFAEKILEPRGMRGVFCVCPELMTISSNLSPEKSTALISKQLRIPTIRVEPLMNWNDLRQLQNRGHHIASHSSQHHQLNKLTTSELETDIAQAAKSLSDNLGSSATWFAFPFGGSDAVDGRVLATVMQHHSFCLSGVRGHNDPQSPASCLWRQSLHEDNSVELNHRIAFGAYDLRHRRARKQLLDFSRQIHQSPSDRKASSCAVSQA